MANICEMIIGFLIPHRCENPALGVCTQCSRGFCEEHVEVTAQGLVCMACQQGLEQPVVTPAFARSFTQEDFDSFSRMSAIHDFDDEPEDMFSDLS
jgi:hypothetical protein